VISVLLEVLLWTSLVAGVLGLWDGWKEGSEDD